jgi:hypothetical protein
MAAMPTALRLVLWGAGALLALLAFDRLFLWMERRGWIYYRKKTASPRSVGGAFLEIHSLLEPSRKYVIEIEKEEKKEQAESGEPPENEG